MYLKFSHYIRIEERRVKTYGIAVLSAKAIEIRKDVSTDGKAVKQLVKSLNKCKVDVVHIDSVIEDFYINHF